MSKDRTIGDSTIGGSVHRSSHRSPSSNRRSRDRERASDSKKKRSNERGFDSSSSRLISSEMAPDHSDFLDESKLSSKLNDFNVQ